MELIEWDETGAARGSTFLFFVFILHSLEQTTQISSIHSSFSHLSICKGASEEGEVWGGRGYHAAKWVKKRGNEKGRGLNDHLRDGQFKSPSIN